MNDIIIAEYTSTLHRILCKLKLSKPSHIYESLHFFMFYEMTVYFLPGNLPGTYFLPGNLPGTRYADSINIDVKEIVYDEVREQIDGKLRNKRRRMRLVRWVR